MAPYRRPGKGAHCVMSPNDGWEGDYLVVAQLSISGQKPDNTKVYNLLKVVTIFLESCCKFKLIVNNVSAGMQVMWIKLPNTFVFQFLLSGTVKEHSLSAPPLSI